MDDYTFLLSLCVSVKGQGIAVAHSSVSHAVARKRSFIHSFSLRCSQIEGVPEDSGCHGS